MGTEDRREPGALDSHRDRSDRLCCVYWCRERAVVIVQLADGQVGSCRKHAAFISIGKMDWFER